LAPTLDEAPKIWTDKLRNQQVSRLVTQLSSRLSLKSKSSIHTVRKARTVQLEIVSGTGVWASL